MHHTVLLLALVACASDVPRAEAPPSGECISTTREDSVTVYADIVTWYDAQGRQIRQTRDAYEADGSWLGSTVSEHGYVDDLLMSYTVEGETTEGSSVDRTLYAYDEEGRPIEEQVRSDDTLRYTRTFRYDELGQRIGGEQVDHLFDLDTVTERWWSEGRVDGWETRGPEGQVWFYEDYEYLAPAPVLDRKVTAGGSEWVERYDGEWLIEREGWAEGALASLLQWVRRPDGQVELERRIDPDQTYLTRSAFDADGHVVRRTWGLDLDGDDQIDEWLSEQTWDWSCDGRAAGR